MKSRRLASALLLSVFLATACSTGSGAPADESTVAARSAPHAALPPQWQRGVSWVAGEEIDSSHLEPLVDMGVTHIVQTPFGWQRGAASPEVKLVTSGRVFWGERDEGLEVTTRLAAELGIETLLKPHIWLRDPNGLWRSDIRMESEEDWQLWFASYGRFILHYAALAERLQIPALAVGTELHATVTERPEDWRKLIGEIRQVYGGRLTYAANWWREFEEVSFWDALDFIGIQAYFPLSDEDSPTLEDLVQGWQPHLKAIEALQRRVGKPVVFTEVGYRSMADAAIEPWKWPSQQDLEAALYDPETQARCYEAFFRVFGRRPDLVGAYWWKWFPRAEVAGGPGHPGFTPQNKPAAAILQRWYRGAQPEAQSHSTP